MNKAKLFAKIGRKAADLLLDSRVTQHTYLNGFEE
jgi:hypothetical protein